MTFEEAQNLVMKYARERGWDKANSSRGIAISLSLEANELLEHFQWSEKSVGSKEEMASELADVLIYAIQFAAKNDIDIPQAIANKLVQQEKKYPAKLFNTDTDDEDEQNRRWLEAKKNYKKDGALWKLWQSGIQDENQNCLTILSPGGRRLKVG